MKGLFQTPQSAVEAQFLECCSGGGALSASTLRMRQEISHFAFQPSASFVRLITLFDVREFWENILLPIFGGNMNYEHEKALLKLIKLS